MLSSIGGLSVQTLSLKSNNTQPKQATSGSSTESTTDSKENFVQNESGKEFYPKPSLTEPARQLGPQADIDLKDLNLSQGTALTSEHIRLDTPTPLPEEGLHTPDLLKQDVPRAWKLPTETMKSFTTAHNAAIESSGKMDLSFEERKNYLQSAKESWVEDKRQNDPEMFTEWLKLNKDKIFNGQLAEVGLPSDFTVDDYYSYVKESFSTWA